MEKFFQAIALPVFSLLIVAFVVCGCQKDDNSDPITETPSDTPEETPKEEDYSAYLNSAAGIYEAQWVVDGEKIDTTLVISERDSCLRIFHIPADWLAHQFLPEAALGNEYEITDKYHQPFSLNYQPVGYSEECLYMSDLKGWITYSFQGYCPLQNPLPDGFKSCFMLQSYWQNPNGFTEQERIEHPDTLIHNMNLYGLVLFINRTSSACVFEKRRNAWIATLAIDSVAVEYSGMDCHWNITEGFSWDFKYDYKVQHLSNSLHLNLVTTRRIE